MNKKYLVILTFLLIMPLAFAEEVVKVDNINVYVESTNQGSVDKEGGKFKVTQGESIEITLNLKNNWNQSLDVKVEGWIDDIDNGGDLNTDKTKEIIHGDDKTFTLYFFVPDDARERVYDMEFRISYDYNSTSKSYLVDDFFVDVEEDGEKKQQELELFDSFTNMTNTCFAMSQTANNCLTKIGEEDNCKDELSTCKEERGTYNTEKTNCQQTLTDCQSERDSCRSEKNNIEIDRNNRLTRNQCNNLTASEIDIKVKAAEESTRNFFLMILGGIGIAAFLYFKKNKGVTVDDKYYFKK